MEKNNDNNNKNKVREISGIVIGLIAVLVLIGFYSNTDAFLLAIIRNLLKDGIGIGGYILPFILFFISISCISKRLRINRKFYAWLSFLITVYFIISLVTLDKYTAKTYLDSIREVINTTSTFHGGILGLSLMMLLENIIGFWGGLILLIAVNIISLILLLDKSLIDIMQNIKKKINNPIGNFRNSNKQKKELKHEEVKEVKENTNNKKLEKKSSSIVKFLSKSLYLEAPEELPPKNEETDTAPIEENLIDKSYIHKDDTSKKLDNKEIVVESKNVSVDSKIDTSFLKNSSDLNLNIVDENLDKKQDMLQKMLDDFRVKAKIINVEKGPAVTRYEVELDKGVKVSKILSLADDIALVFATNGIRIEAPIPGKSLVGIEVPNDSISMIGMKEILDSDEFNSSKLKISIALGKDISGKIIVADLVTMPHLLIAGATGSGKSVCINTILVSILYKYSPEQVKIILIDPKVVELNVYNGISHLLIPVVTDPKKASSALNWAVLEMTNRYNKFAQRGVRNIDSYNEIFKDNIEEKLSYIVIVIDELADLMMVCHNEVEDSITRLAQMARAAGIHLIIATQRPSVDVITGLIKANIPSRISFSVSSSIDSRTILDQSGAEKLLGKGDMLFYPMGYLKPQRVQGVFISEKEVEKFVEKTKDKFDSIVEYNKEIMEHINSNVKFENDNSQSDELMDEAINVIFETNNVTASMLQRRLRIGYNRAANIIEELERRGIIGTRGSSNKKEILVDKNNFLN